MIIVLWGGPDDGRLMETPDQCSEIKASQMGDLATESEPTTSPSVETIRYYRTGETDRAGHWVFR